MGRFALYRDESRPIPRSEVVLEPGLVTLHRPDGSQHAIALDGCVAFTLDAASCRRFVRMLIVEKDGARELELITPPEQGAIAPRATRLPEAPVGAAVVDPVAWEALADWLGGGGRLTACSVAELARLATIASPHFATLIGEVAAQVALEMVWETFGPWRGGLELEHALRPLADAARGSSRAAEALVAALSAASVQPRRRTG